jgi:RNA polymerase primary sigma factor
MKSIADGRTASAVKPPVFLQEEEGLQAYLREIRKYRSLTYREERDVLARMHAGDKQAFRTLIEANLRFVAAVCRRYQHQGLSMTDLVGEGNLGLIRAAMHFDVTRTCRFITYAVWWIRQRILQALSEQGRCLSLPLGKTAAMQKVSQAQKVLEQKLGRTPTAGEVADTLSMKEKDIRCLQVMRQPSLSMEAPAGGEEGFTFGDLLEDAHTPSPDRLCMEDRLQKDIQHLLSGLRPREREILRLYFGLGEGRNLSLDEIGERIGLTRERVRQVKDIALRRLRHPSRRGLLAELY